MHSSSFNFREELYKPIRESSRNEKYNFVLPHKNPDKPFSSKIYLKNDCDLLIAEATYPSVGLGIELGWADLYKVPIACVYKENTEVSDSLRAVSTNFMEYSNDEELIEVVGRIIEKLG